MSEHNWVHKRVPIRLAGFKITHRLRTGDSNQATENKFILKLPHQSLRETSLS